MARLTSLFPAFRGLLTSYCAMIVTLEIRELEINVRHRLRAPQSYMGLLDQISVNSPARMLPSFRCRNQPSNFGAICPVVKPKYLYASFPGKDLPKRSIFMQTAASAYLSHP